MASEDFDGSWVEGAVRVAVEMGWTGSVNVNIVDRLDITADGVDTRPSTSMSA
jgi:hypothetical protein